MSLVTTRYHMLRRWVIVLSSHHSGMIFNVMSVVDIELHGKIVIARNAYEVDFFVRYFQAKKFVLCVYMRAVCMSFSRSFSHPKWVFSKLKTYSEVSKNPLFFILIFYINASIQVKISWTHDATTTKKFVDISLRFHSFRHKLAIPISSLFLLCHWKISKVRRCICI